MNLQQSQLGCLKAVSYASNILTHLRGKSSSYLYWEKANNMLTHAHNESVHLVNICLYI